MKQLLRHLLLLACWLGANGAFAGLYVGRDDKPKTTPKAFNNHAYNVDVPPLGGANHATGVAKPASHPIAQTVVGVSGVNPSRGWSPDQTTQMTNPHKNETTTNT